MTHNDSDHGTPTEVLFFLLGEDEMAYWDDVNPWREDLVYVPIKELAECMMYIDGATALSHWQHAGDKLDAYILKNGISAGIRYGADGHQYISPYPDAEKLKILLQKYIKNAPQKTDQIH